MLAGMLGVLTVCAEPEPRAPDKAMAAAGDPDCGMRTVWAHPEAMPLLREFVERDARGEFVRSSAWFAGAVTCPDHEPAPDVAMEASEHRVRTLGITADTAKIEVVWTRLSYVSATRMEEALGADVDTLTAVRTNHGWRVLSPALNPHMPPMVPRAK